MAGPTKDVARHCDEDELAEAIDEAQKVGKARLIRRLCFIRNLYEGDSITEAAGRVGVTQPTGSRWVEAWNEDGVAGLEPKFSDGRPPKLSEREKERLTVALERHQPLTTAQVQRLLEEGFDVSYSQRHITRLLRSLELDRRPSRLERSEPSETAESILEQNLRDALAELDRKNKQ